LSKDSGNNLPERIYQLTTASKKFNEFPMDFNHEAWTKTRLFLFALRVRLGLSENVTELEINELCRFLKKEFSFVNREQLSEAFDMFCAQSLDLDYKKQGHFNKVSNSFIGLVLKSYLTFQRVQLAKRTHQISTYVQPTIELEEYFLKVLIEPYEKMLADGAYPYSVLDGWMLYDKLFKIIKCTDEQRAEYRELAVTITLKDQNKKESQEDYARRVTKNAKHLAFKDWIQEKALEEFDLRTFILDKIKNKEVTE
jgi:hypothetical protein